MDGTQPEKKLCVKCKSFCGNEAFNWMCSVCYKNSKPAEQKKPKQSEQKPEEKPEPPKAPAQADRERCQACNKKIGLLGIECKCGYVYCNLHRMPEEHNCSVNYRELGREKISKENTKIAQRKVSDI